MVRTINARIDAIDEVLSKQVDKILHHPDFQKLEGSWRGLKQLVMSTETGETLKIKVFNVSKKDLQKDFGAAAEFTESALWKKIYEFEFGTYGGDPFGALMGDYEFDKGPQDVALLDAASRRSRRRRTRRSSRRVSPKMFGMDSFTQMPDPRDLAKIFDKSNPENTKWISFRDSEDSRFVRAGAAARAAPAALQRGGEPGRGLPTTRRTSSNEHEEYLWGNAAYDFAARLTAAFAKHHWCVAIRGPEGGGLVEGLPIHVFKSREGDVGAKMPDRGADPRHAREGALRPRLHRPAPLQEHRLRGVLRRQLGAAPEEVRHQGSDGEREAVAARSRI